MKEGGEILMKRERRRTRKVLEGFFQVSVHTNGRRTPGLTGLLLGIFFFVLLLIPNISH